MELELAAASSAELGRAPRPWPQPLPPPDILGVFTRTRRKSKLGRAACNKRRCRGSLLPVVTSTLPAYNQTGHTSMGRHALELHLTE